ncbi:MAG: 5-formyltetrahydrofolate cyclo-ligase [Thermoprotei archaeon]|nr:MAG: 5-formyltetrahydrofolate cyclo-ligase [Thermoprotei archaeon]
MNVLNSNKDNDEIKVLKKRIRMRIWELMERNNIAIFPRPVYGRIPNFKMSEVAARRLIETNVFQKAEVVFVCPDSPQRPIREAVIRMEKTLIMATPKLRKGFIIIKPRSVPRGLEWKASTIRGAFKYGKLVNIPEVPIDLKVTGSVAVTLDGARLGKGGGFSDLEYAILRELGLIDDSTPVVTTVHDVQIVDYIPMTKHDVPIDYIFTPTRSIRTNVKYEKPKGIYLDELDKTKIEEIPILRNIISYKLRNRKNYNSAY